VAENSPARSFPDRVIPTNMAENTGASTFDQIMTDTPAVFAVKWFNKQFYLNRSFVLASLKSYPGMILPDRVQDPPPFIHQHFSFEANGSGSQAQARKIRQPPLQNCAAIVRWYSVRDKDNTVFIGNTIRLETERLLKEVCWIYLMRAAENIRF
jgi:hypothetical protein